MARSEMARRIEPITEMNTSSQSDEIEIDPIELMYRLLERWKVIVVIAVLFAVIATTYISFFTVPMYEAVSRIYVLTSKDSAVNLADLQIGAILAADYLEVFNTWEVHEMVVSNLNLSYTYSEIRDMLTITNPGGTRILDISVKSPIPGEAAAIANEYASVSREFIAEIMATEQPNILSVALVPTNPIDANKTRNVILAFLAGGFLACAVIFVIFLLDDRIKTADDIQKYTGMPTLAVIPVAVDTNAKVQNRKSKKK